MIVGVTGGIACYKVAHVVSRLAQAGSEVTVAMTDAATRFVGPLTFQALSGRPVYTSQWTHVESQDPQHVNLARAAYGRVGGGRGQRVVDIGEHHGDPGAE